MKRRVALAGLGALLLTSACAFTPDVTTDHDPAANFAAFHSYGWVEQPVPMGANPLLFERVRASVDRYMAGRGFSRSDQPDFLIGAFIATQQRIEINDFGPDPFWPRGGWGGRYWGPGWGAGFSRVDVRQIPEGRLVIDIYEAPSRKPVWHGVGVQRLDSENVPEEVIDLVVQAVLDQFPPGFGPAS